MKPSSISAEALFEAHRVAMRWEWIAGHAHPERRFDDAAVWGRVSVGVASDDAPHVAGVS